MKPRSTCGASRWRVASSFGSPLVAIPRLIRSIRSWRRDHIVVDDGGDPLRAGLRHGRAAAGQAMQHRQGADQSGEWREQTRSRSPPPLSDSEPNSEPPVSKSARFLKAIRNRNAVSSPNSASGVKRCSKPDRQDQAGVRIDQARLIGDGLVGAEVAPGLAADGDLIGELDAHAQRDLLARLEAGRIGVRVALVVERLRLARQVDVAEVEAQEARAERGQGVAAPELQIALAQAGSGSSGRATGWAGRRTRRHSPRDCPARRIPAE